MVFHTLCFLQNEKGFVNFKRHYHYHVVKVPSSFSWYHSKAASSLSCQRHLSAYTLVNASVWGPYFFFLPLLKMCTPPSQPSLVFGRFCHGDHAGSLKPDVCSNVSVSHLAWQWELTFLGAQILQSLLPRVDKYIDEKSPHHFYSLSVWLHIVLFWFTTHSQIPGLIVSIICGCHL